MRGWFNRSCHRQRIFKTSNPCALGFSPVPSPHGICISHGQVSFAARLKGLILKPCDGAPHDWESTQKGAVWVRLQCGLTLFRMHMSEISENGRPEKLV